MSSFSSSLLSVDFWARLKHDPALEHALFPEGTDRTPYEVLDYDAVLVLIDGGGRAILRRIERIRFLQEGVSALLDHAWGDGVLAGYHNDAGTIRASFKDGAYRHLVIDLGRQMTRGSELTFRVVRERMAAFLHAEEWVETVIDHPVRRMKRMVLFPKERPCHQAVLTFGGDTITVPIEEFADGRTRIWFEILEPVPNVPYRLTWSW